MLIGLPTVYPAPLKSRRARARKIFQSRLVDTQVGAC
jgi:hypothetical protein